MDANNINTGVSQKVDEFNWFKPNSSVHIEGVKISAPDFSIPPTPASSYSNLHVVLDHVHPSSETITRSVLPASTHFTGPYSGPSIPEEIISAPLPSVPSFASRDIPISSGSPSMSDNKLDNVPSTTFRAVPEAVNPELPGARAQDALTSLKSEISPIQPAMVPLEEFDTLAERKDRQLPETVDLALTDESQKWTEGWNKVGDDVRHKNWNLHHYQPERDSFWGKQWNTVGNDIKNKSWNLKHKTIPSSFKINSWAMIDQLEDAERRYRQVHGINGVWSGRVNRVHHELLSFVTPIGWAQWFINLKNKVANRSADLINSASDATKDLANRVVDTAATDYNIAKDVTEDLASRAANTAVADYDIVKDTAKDLISRAADTAAVDFEIVKDTAKDLITRAADTAAVDFEIVKDAGMKLARTLSDSVNSASNAIADKVNDLTTVPLPKFNGALWTDSELYMPQLFRKVPADIIAMEELERADRMSRGINPIVSGMWHRLGREMLHTYREDLAELFNGLRNQIAKKGLGLVDTAKTAINNLSLYKAPESVIAPREVGFEYAPINFDWSRRVPADIIALEEMERADRIMRGINPIVSGLWYRLGLELKHKFSVRPTLASTATMIAEVATDLAGMAMEKLSDLSGAVMQTKDAIMDSTVLAAPAADFVDTGAHLNLFAYTAEPIDFTFKSRRCPGWIKMAEEAERADRVAEGVDALAYSKWNNLLSQPHKTLADSPSMVSSVVPTLTAAKDSLVESGKGITGYFGSWASSMANVASSYIDAAKHSHIAEVAMDYVHPDQSSVSSINKAEELERVRRMNEKVDPMLAARLGRVQEELLGSIKSV